MFVVDRLGKQADDDSSDGDDSKQQHAEVQIMNVLDDRWSSVLRFLAALYRRVGALPRKPRYTNHQANHQTPERTLHT